MATSATRTVRLTRLLGSLIVIGALAACNVPGVSSTPASVALSDFTVTVPGGWTDKTNDSTAVAKLNVTPPDKVVMLFTGTRPGSFERNVNDVTPQMNCATVTPTVASADFKDYFDNYSDDAKNMTPIENITVGGEKAAAVTFDVDVAGTPGKTRDIVVTHKGVTYDFAYTTASVNYATQLGDFTSTIASLTWTT